MAEFLEQVYDMTYLSSLEQFADTPLEPIQAPTVDMAEFEFTTTIQYPAHASEAYLKWDQQQVYIWGKYIREIYWFTTYTAPVAFL